MDPIPGDNPTAAVKFLFAFFFFRNYFLCFFTLLIFLSAPSILYLYSLLTYFLNPCSLLYSHSRSSLCLSPRSLFLLVHALCRIMGIKGFGALLKKKFVKENFLLREIENNSILYIDLFGCFFYEILTKNFESFEKSQKKKEVSPVDRIDWINDIGMHTILFF